MPTAPGWFLQLPPNLRQHGIQIFKHALILKAQYLDLETQQKRIAFFVAQFCLGTVVYGAVEFDCELCRRTIKIKDVPAYTMLAAKFHTLEL